MVKITKLTLTEKIKLWQHQPTHFRPQQVPRFVRDLIASRLAWRNAVEKINQWTNCRQKIERRTLEAVARFVAAMLAADKDL